VPQRGRETSTWSVVERFAGIGQLDSIHLSIAPVTLGTGAPLFPSYFDSTRLSLTKVHQTGQFIQAEYDVRPA
jgi:dihydrofolate reductase